ncbi:hypothetical protein [Tenacibaculum sp.]|uniref:hypothetical protein n=1 Tax=Tenacibaculum sp. TaxID=1906242 RepID=UPI003AA7CEFD
MDNILNEIDSLLEDLNQKVLLTQDVVEDVLKTEFEIKEALKANHEVVPLKFKAINQLSKNITSRSFDVSHSYGFGYVQNIIGQKLSQSIFQFEYGNFKYSISFSNRIIIQGNTDNDGFENTLTLLSPITIKGNISEVQHLKIKLFLYAKSVNENILFFINSLPVFYDLEMNLTDPFESIPISQNNPNKIRDTFLKVISDELNNVNISIPPIKLNSNNLSLSPFDIMITNSLDCFVKADVKRKIAYPLPLVRLIHQSYFNQYVFIRKEFFSPLIEREVRKQAVRVNRIEFKNNYVDLGVYKKKSTSCLHISTTVRVWMDYYLRVSTQYGNIFIQARWRKWKRSIEAKRCWPICNDVIDKAKDASTPLINNAKKYDIYIGSTTSYASRSQGKFTKTGFELLTKLY